MSMKNKTKNFTSPPPFATMKRKRARSQAKGSTQVQPQAHLQGQGQAQAQAQGVLFQGLSQEQPLHLLLQQVHQITAGSTGTGSGSGSSSVGVEDKKSAQGNHGVNSKQSSTVVGTASDLGSSSTPVQQQQIIDPVDDSWEDDDLGNDMMDIDEEYQQYLNELIAASRTQFHVDIENIEEYQQPPQLQNLFQYTPTNTNKTTKTKTTTPKPTKDSSPTTSSQTKLSPFKQFAEELKRGNFFPTLTREQNFVVKEVNMTVASPATISPTTNSQKKLSPFKQFAEELKRGNIPRQTTEQHFTIEIMKNGKRTTANEFEKPDKEPDDLPVVSTKVESYAQAMNIDFTSCNTNVAKSNCEFLVVVDTNVLISNLKTVKSFKDRNVILVVPWIVLCELDNLKMRAKDNKLSLLARSAINFMLSESQKNSRFLRGQTLVEVKLGSSIYRTMIGDDSEVNNDDRVMQCCLYFRESRTIEYERIFLLSNDKNLCLKAIVNGLEGINIGQFESILNDPSRKRKQHISTPYQNMEIHAPTKKHSSILSDINFSQPHQSPQPTQSIEQSTIFQQSQSMELS